MTVQLEYNIYSDDDIGVDRIEVEVDETISINELKEKLKVQFMLEGYELRTAVIKIKWAELLK